MTARPRRVFVYPLASGLNGTGLSCLFSVESGSGDEASERTVHSRCLVNAGDCTQRVLQQHRFKLHKVTAIVLTSLAPHCVSGLAGVLLCLADLGVAAVTLLGPSGTRGLLQVMQPFTNKKYPELTVVEVEGGGSCQPQGVDVDAHSRVVVYPVSTSEGGGGSSVALAALLLMRPPAPPAVPTSATSSISTSFAAAPTKASQAAAAFIPVSSFPSHPHTTALATHMLQTLTCTPGAPGLPSLTDALGMTRDSSGRSERYHCHSPLLVVFVPCSYACRLPLSTLRALCARLGLTGLW